MKPRTDNTQNTAEELRQAARRLGDGAAYVAREVPWAALVKGTFTLAINILRYSMGIAIYGLIIWPYRLLVAPACAVAAGMSRDEPLRVVIVDSNGQPDSRFRSTEAFGDGEEGFSDNGYEFDEHEDYVNGNIHVSIGDGSFHMTNHERLDTI